jgi:hypothetical protein
MRKLILLTLAGACSGGGNGKGSSNPTVVANSLPEPRTEAVLAGPLCTTDRCECRDQSAPADAGAGVPDDAETKRYEVHVGPAENGLWVTVDGMVLYKSDERAEDCFYVDLRPGKHKVTLQASRGGGISAKVAISEYSPATQSWYDTFNFNCGSPGACAYDDLDAWKVELEKYTRGIHDPCGSTKVEGIVWDAGRAPDQAHPQDLYLELVLDIYKFAPKYPHDDEECRDRIAE